MSHELRTPLTVISGSAQLLVDRDVPAPQQTLMLSRIEANAQALNDIVTRLLDFSKLEAGKLELRRAAVNMSRLAEMTLGRLRPLFEAHEVEVDVAPGLWIDGDHALLEGAMENLLSNGSRHTPPGTTITLRVRAVDGEVEVMISDNGPGIATADLKHLGERFFRGAVEDRPKHGLGLGLAFAREIFEHHGIVLQVDSELGHGTSFSVRMPRITEPGISSDRPTGSQRA